MKVKAPIWGMVPISLLLDESLTPNDVKVYAALSSFQGNKDHCWPSRNDIAERTGISPSGVTKALTELVDAGWIIRQTRCAESKSNVYYVLLEADLPEDNDPPIDEDDTPLPESQVDPLPNQQADPLPDDQAHDYIYKTTKKNTTIQAPHSDAGKPASVEDTPLTELSEKDRELYHALKESFLSQVTGGKFTNWPKEAKGLKRLLRYSTTFAVDNRSDWLQALLEAFLKLVEGHDKFWSNQPFLPSVLASDGIFPRVHKEMVGSIKDKAVADYMTKNNLW